MPSNRATRLTSTSGRRDALVGIERVAAQLFDSQVTGQPIHPCELPQHAKQRFVRLHHRRWNTYPNRGLSAPLWRCAPRSLRAAPRAPTTVLGMSRRQIERLAIRYVAEGLSTQASAR